MTFLQIEYFIEAARCGSFHKAAENLYVSQQGVSSQIAAIERELDIKLFDRSNRKQMTLTKEGQLLYQRWSEILSLYKTSMEDVMVLSGKKKKHLRIGIFEAGPIADYVMPMITSFRAQEPETEVECIFSDEESVMNGIQDGSLDLVFALCSKYRDYVINCYPIYYDRVCIAVSKRHPLAQKDSVSVKDILDVPVYLLNSNYSYDAHDNILKMLEKNHYDMSHIVEVKDVNNLEMMLYTAQGVTLAPRILLRNTHDDIRFFPITDAVNGDSIILHVIWKNDKKKQDAMKIIGMEH